MDAISVAVLAFAAIGSIAAIAFALWLIVSAISKAASSTRDDSDD